MKSVAFFFHVKLITPVYFSILVVLFFYELKINYVDWLRCVSHHVFADLFKKLKLIYPPPKKKDFFCVCVSFNFGNKFEMVKKTKISQILLWFLNRLKVFPISLVIQLLNKKKKSKTKKKIKFLFSFFLKLYPYDAPWCYFLPPSPAISIIIIRKWKFHWNIRKKKKLEANTKTVTMEKKVPFILK